jgi:23S rRNA (uracil1939-C5)-methyltransferase
MQFLLFVLSSFRVFVIKGLPHFYVNIFKKFTMTVKKNQLIETAITGMAFGGKGLAKIDGFTVFVDQAIAGDSVVARIIKKKKNYAEATIDQLIKPSPDRVEAKCGYSGFCGGCKWQFLDYQKQIFYKRQHIQETMEHIGSIRDILIHETIPSVKIFGYRNKMEFSCSDRRWLLPDEMGQTGVDRTFALGLHVPGTFYKVLDTKACLLQPDLGNHILDDVRQYIKNSSAPVYGLRTHVGFWRFVMLRHSAARDQWMLNIITSAEDRDQVMPLADRMMQKYPRIVSIVNNITAGKAGVAMGEYELNLAGKEHLRESIDSYTFMISANSFFQTNTVGAGILYRQAKKYADLQGRETVLDLYSGTGSIAIFLSGSARRVIGIEQVASAVQDARRNCEINGIDNCRFVQGDIAACLPQIKEKPDVMIIDPPRAGMHKNVVKQVIEMAPARIVYVSCNPASLARDASMMKEKYRLLEIQPVDMFPHTYHIEAVAKLERI